MKKIYFSLILLLSMAFASCDMDKAPYGSLDEQTAIQSLNDVLRYRNGFYGALRGMTSGYWIYDQEIQMDGFLGTISNGNREGEFSNGTINSSTYDIEDFWSVPYYYIQEANYIIPKIDELIASGSFDDDEITDMKRYQGEAHFLRAFCYFWLADKYCPAYTSSIGDTQAKGVPIVTTYAPSGNVESYPSRSTLNETFSLIEEDLAAAYSALKSYESTDASAVAPNANYISSYTVRALQARVALQKKDNANALKYAKEVINSGVYSLTTNETFAAMWTDDEGTEIIFQPFMSNTELGSSIGGVFLSSDETSADYLPTYTFANAYEDTDARYYAYIGEYKLVVEGGQYYAWVFSKYPGNAALRTSTTPNFMNMTKPFRLAEQYLIAAEAAYNTGATSEATNYLNTLRANRIEGYDTSTGYSASGLRDEIRTERVKELFGEGFRMGDLRRWGIGFKRDSSYPSDIFGYLDDVIVKAGKGMTYAADDYRFIWPIPSAEIDANPNLKGQQNPGY